MIRSPRFFWYSLSTADIDAALAFYIHVVGWTASEYPGSDPRYVVLEAGGRGVAGVRAADASAPGDRPGWTGYVPVTDVDAVARAVADGGGAVLTGPGDIPGVGRFAVVADPQGTPFEIMAPNGPDQPPVPFATPGHAGWNELHSTDAKAGLRFYEAQFGWTKLNEFEMGPMGTYRIFAIDGEQAGGMFNSPLAPPPFWMHYFNVEDIDAAHARIETTEAEIMHGPAEVPGGGYIIQGRDPEGLIFAVSGPRKA